MLSFKPDEAIVCSGGSIQANLADRLREVRIPLHVVREDGATAPVAKKVPVDRDEPVAKRVANEDDLPPF